MKKLIILALIYFPTVLAAQTDTVVAKVKMTTVINPMIGMTYSALNNEPEGLESKARIGWHLGVNFRFGDQFYFEPGFQYVMLNSEFQSTSGPIVDTATLGNTDINVLRIPLMVGVRMLSNENKDNPMNINVHFGLDLGIVTSIEQSNKALTSNDFKNPMLGAVIGAGIDFLSFTFNVDYSYGLTAVFDESYTPFGKEPRANTLYFSIGTKYQL
ncbi:MAG TPA: porin family protein [Candidatus Kapabacteria bacterium]